MITLSKTQSICPVCHRPVKAEYVLEAGKVMIRKKCPEHGEVSALVARNPQDYIRWTKHPVVNIPPKVNITKGSEGECPADSMLRSHRRNRQMQPALSILLCKGGGFGKRYAAARDRTKI